MLLSLLFACHRDEPATSAPIPCDEGELVRRIDGDIVEAWCQSGAGADGPYVKFTTSGWTLREGAFATSQPASTWTDWYPADTVETPTIERVASYDDGRIDGEETRYDTAGELVATRFWRAGVPCDTWTERVGDATLTRSFPACDGVAVTDLDGRDLLAPTDVDLWDGETCPSGASAVDDGELVACARGDVAHGPSLRWWNAARTAPAEQGAWEDGVAHGPWRTFHATADAWGLVASTAGERDGGERSGTWRTWRADRTLVTRGDYVDGVEHGAWTGYQPSLLVAWEGTYDHGAEQGLWRTFHPGGHVATEVAWDAGRRHGPFTEYFASGGVFREGAYADGQREGLDTVYWEDGTKRSEVTWVDGLANGRTRGWYADGEAAWDYTFVDGAAHGPATLWFDPDTVLLTFGVTARVAATFTFVEGGAHGAYEQRYVDDDDVPQGLARVGTYEQGRATGPVTFYHPAGGVLAEGAYVANLAEGPWATWYAGGEPHETYGYRAGRRNGAYVARHENGVTKRTGTYENDVRVGTWTTYDTAGNVIDVESCPRESGGCP